jgi:ribose 5-phosphate isomerase
LRVAKCFLHERQYVMVGESRVVASLILNEVPLEIFEKTLHIVVANLPQEAIRVKIDLMAFEVL